MAHPVLRGIRVALLPLLSHSVLGKTAYRNLQLGLFEFSIICPFLATSRYHWICNLFAIQPYSLSAQRTEANVGSHCSLGQQ